jgi:hypothetical protein
MIASENPFFQRQPQDSVYAATEVYEEILGVSEDVRAFKQDAFKKDVANNGGMV